MDRKERPEKILSIVNGLIDLDLDFILDGNKRAANRNKGTKRAGKETTTTLVNEHESRRNHEQFAGYLATVISHSIGLRASVSPFNVSQESMLAYLMDVFKLTESQLEAILLDSISLPREADKNTDSSRKYHNWQPELRLQLHPPMLAADSRVEDLTVRLYLSTEPIAKTGGGGGRASNDLPGESNSILDLIRRGRRDASMPPFRPNSELLMEVKFERQEETYRAVATTTTTTTTRRRRASSSSNSKSGNSLPGDQDEDELRLRLHRHHCDPKSAYVLGLEFWLRETKTIIGVETMKRLINCTTSSCWRAPNTTETPSSPPPYTVDGKQFYGFTNIKLHQIPAYGIKTSYPIQSVQEKFVNSCEVCLDYVNGGNDLYQNGKVHEYNDDVINHVRLYSIVMAHQLALLAEATDNNSNSSSSVYPAGLAATLLQASPNLNNLLFMPAFSIINQHRLQTNLSQLEDQSLRRAAVLLLLLRLASRHDFSIFPSSHRLLLMSIAEHEYLNAHRYFNNTIRQEVDVFHRDATVDRSRDCVKILERDAIESFANGLVSPNRIRTWLAKINSIDSEKLDSLASLRLAKTILGHNENNPMVDIRLKSRSVLIREQLNQLLTDSIAEELRLRLGAIISSTNVMQPQQKARMKRRKLKPRGPANEAPSQGYPMNPWQRLSCDIHMIDNDIILHWSDRGLNCIKLHQSTSNNNLMNDEDTQKLKAIISNKLNNYLASKS